MKTWMVLSMVLMGTWSGPVGAQPGPLLAQVDAGYNRLITSVVVSAPDTWRAGQVLSVTMTGRSGGQATFDMGPVLGLPLYEGPPGTYTGSYILTDADATLSNPVVLGHLHMPDGQTADGRPPASGSLVMSINTGSSAPLYPGQTFQVRADGPPGGSATFDAGTRYGIPLQEVAAGVYVGSYTVQPGDPSTCLVVSHLTLNSGAVLTSSQSPVYVSGTATGAMQIVSIMSPARGLIVQNQTIPLTVTGTPGLTGFYQVAGGPSYPLAEVSPGTYVGNYTVPPNAFPGAEAVTFTLRDPSGRTVSRMAPFTWNVGSGAAVGAGGGEVVIDSPTMRSDVAGGFRVEGHSIPGSTVHIQVFRTAEPVPGGRHQDRQFDTRVVVAPDGSFAVPVYLNGAGPGQWLDVRVESLDSTGGVAGQDEVVVQLR